MALKTSLSAFLIVLIVWGAAASDSHWTIHIEDDTKTVSIEEAPSEPPGISLYSASNPSDYIESITSGDELRSLLTKNVEKIIVILWYRNEYGHWYLNRNNHEARGSLMTILGKNHPNVEYHEVDLSEYNLNADTYDDLAKELGIDLKMLYDAPIALVVHNIAGEAFTTDKGSLTLVKMIDKYIHKTEKQLYGTTAELCDTETTVKLVSNYAVPNVLDLEKKHKELHHKSVNEDHVKPSSSKPVVTVGPKTAKQEKKESSQSETKAVVKPEVKEEPKKADPKKEEPKKEVKREEKKAVEKVAPAPPSPKPSPPPPKPSPPPPVQVTEMPPPKPAQPAFNGISAKATNPYANEIMPVEYTLEVMPDYHYAAPSRSHSRIEYPSYTPPTFRRPEDIYRGRY